MLRVLIACECSGNMRDAFLARGHDAWSCDLQPSERPGPHIQGDARKAIRWGWDLLIAHPVCTRLANSGVRWLNEPPAGRTVEEMWGELGEAAAFYRELRDAPIPFKAIENPVMHGHAQALVRPGRRFHVQPWWFGDPAFKSTGFELIGLPPLEPTNRLVPPPRGSDEHKAWSAVHRESPGPNRQKNRSRSYPGICAAAAAQWGDHVEMQLFREAA